MPACSTLMTPIPLLVVLLIRKAYARIARSSSKDMTPEVITNYFLRINKSLFFIEIVARVVDLVLQSKIRIVTPHRPTIEPNATIIHVSL